MSGKREPGPCAANSAWLVRGASEEAGAQQKEVGECVLQLPLTPHQVRITPANLGDMFLAVADPSSEIPKLRRPRALIMLGSDHIAYHISIERAVHRTFIDSADVSITSVVTPVREPARRMPVASRHRGLVL